MAQGFDHLSAMGGRHEPGDRQGRMRPMTPPESGMLEPSPIGVRDTVALRLPASSAYLSVLRMATAGLASRLDFTVDDLDDLKIAVDEACALLLPKAAPDANLECAFEMEHGELRLSVTLDTTDGGLPSRDTFAWTVLTALASDVDTSADGTRVTISMVKRREPPQAATA